MKLNEKQLVMQSVQGRIHHPTMSGNGYRVGYDGIGRIPMATGGITYNFAVGDCCMGIAGDHVEPGISLKNADPKENAALMAFACIGNRAKVISGDAKGAIGYVSGKHGGIDHVLICFPKADLENMAVNDQILIYAHGQGLKLLEHEEIHVMNIDPALLKQIPIQEDKAYLSVPVVTKVPAALMGSGLGSATMMNGDYDIMTMDPQACEQYHLNDLKFGDLVLIQDHDNFYGPHYRKGAVSIGVIVHSDSFTSGHGPGAVIIMTAKSAVLKGHHDPNANIANWIADASK